jgi:hypothetical protein
VTPEALREVLRIAKGEAVATCLAAIDEPGATVRTWEGEDETPTANLASIYRIRASWVAEKGIPSLGFHETVERLESTHYKALRLAFVQGASGYPTCVVFLVPDAYEVLAVLSVLGPAPSVA